MPRRPRERPRGIPGALSRARRIGGSRQSTRTPEHPGAPPIAPGTGHPPRAAHSPVERPRASVRDTTRGARDPLRPPPEASTDPLATPSRPLRSHPDPSPDRPRVFDWPSGYGLPPQIRRVSSVHIMGTAKLSQAVSTGQRGKERPCSSEGCGFVDEGSPQGVENVPAPRVWKRLSTENPQAGGGFPQRSGPSPHGCPLFGNSTAPIAASSESRHTKLPGWAVGNVGKPGDAPGENSALPGDGVCRTFCSPQNTRVIHGLRPQARWIKLWP